MYFDYKYLYNDKFDIGDNEYALQNIFVVRKNLNLKTYSNNEKKTCSP